MKTIAIISQKGGAGKTTLAINLAVASELARKPAVLIDLDPQASATNWNDHRAKQAPAVISAQASRLPEVLATAGAHNAQLAIIDTAPHSENAALAAARAADLILIPCRAAILDIRAIATSADLVTIAKKQAVAVLNAVPSRGTLADEAEEALKSYGLAVAPVRVGHRTAFIHAITAAMGIMEYDPHGKAAEEIKALYKWVCEQADMSTRKQDNMSTRRQERTAVPA
jgi:chromosome partitioning protein